MKKITRRFLTAVFGVSLLSGCSPSESPEIFKKDTPIPPPDASPASPPAPPLPTFPEEPEEASQEGSLDIDESSLKEQEAPLDQETGKTGKYSGIGHYTSPAGSEEIAVSLVLKENIITEVVVIPKATNVQSKRLQEAFAKGLLDAVVGKNIEEISDVGAINGSSLTGAGFLNALQNLSPDA